MKCHIKITHFRELYFLFTQTNNNNHIIKQVAMINRQKTEHVCVCVFLALDEIKKTVSLCVEIIEPVLLKNSRFINAVRI